MRFPAGSAMTRTSSSASGAGDNLCCSRDHATVRTIGGPKSGCRWFNAIWIGPDRRRSSSLPLRELYASRRRMKMRDREELTPMLSRTWKGGAGCLPAKSSFAAGWRVSNRSKHSAYAYVDSDGSLDRRLPRQSVPPEISFRSAIFSVSMTVMGC
jgi:hypothetical protein